MTSCKCGWKVRLRMHNLRSDVVSDAVRAQCMQWLGLAMRAGRLALGNEAVMAAVRGGKAKLVLLAADGGGNTSKKYRDKCAFYNIPMIDVFERAELGRACGRSQMVVIALTDPGFAAKFRNCFGETSGGEAFGETSGI